MNFFASCLRCSPHSTIVSVRQCHTCRIFAAMRAGCDPRRMTRSSARLWLRSARLACVLIPCIFDARVSAQAPSVLDGGLLFAPEAKIPESASVPSKSDTLASAIPQVHDSSQSLREQAAHLRAWMSGNLDPQIDVQSLLHFDLIQDADELSGDASRAAARPGSSPGRTAPPRSGAPSRGPG